MATLVAYTVVSLYKIYLLVAQKSVEWFALSHTIECCLISILLMIVYKKEGGQRLSFDWQMGKDMLSVSKHYIIPGIMVMIFQHTDQIMLKLMTNETETGLYAAAITCIGMTSFVFVAVIESARPTILEAKQKDSVLFEKRMMQLYSIITCMSLVQSIGMTVFAKPLVFLVFGEEYAATAGILSVAVWFVTFGHYGSVRNIWILAEGKQKCLTGINIAGGVANILLNASLIPIFGAVGAAIASVVTQLFTNVIIGFIFKPIHRNNYLMVKSLNPRIAIELLGKVLYKR